ncbi:hypothetical protein KS4_25470 [Poriferisphaera corsica]|uniref:Uncharacterized protein n=1 Tax=Poriferisphaera corsica TaxID=2528020 RepID=A0A517YW88_9BACT|nr:hypothetical protein [Poriferisphaera corsica]QDU34477.1 hypothetical protein KS4_25470 [Poriferisphaera corsica]
MYDLNESGDERAVKKERAVKVRRKSKALVCPSCNAEVGAKAVICLNCGLNLSKGKFVQTAVDKGVVSTVARDGGKHKRAGEVVQTHIPVARKIRDDAKLEFKHDWAEPGIVMGVSLALLFIAMMVTGAEGSATVFANGMSRWLAGPVMTGERIVLALISVPMMFVALSVSNLIFGVSMGKMAAVPLKLMSMSLAVLAVVSVIDGGVYVLTSILPGVGSLLALLGVFIIPIVILIVLTVFTALADHYFEMDYISSTVFYLLGVVLPAVALIVIAGLIIGEKITEYDVRLGGMWG